MGLFTECDFNASAINWVLPHPAGAVMDPRWMANRSISGGTGEGPELIRNRFETSFRVR